MTRTTNDVAAWERFWRTVAGEPELAKDSDLDKTNDRYAPQPDPSWRAALVAVLLTVAVCGGLVILAGLGS